MQELDDIDKKLLNKLQQNNRTTAEELGCLLNLSTSAVQRRLKRLRQDKVIEADISIISPQAAGIGVTCVVEVSLELGSSKEIESFKTLLSGCQEVMQCYYVAGTYDFIIIVNTHDMKHYEQFSRKYLMDNSSVKQFCTHVVLDRVKVSYGVTI
jgi:Lrp/AsnC family leucine-responsive transcriptional regulator